MSAQIRVIFFDLETTGFHYGVQICQIAAFTYNEDNAEYELKFEKYLKPSCQIQKQASKVNQMEMKGNDLYLRGKIVENALPLKIGLEEFLTFLKSFNIRDGLEKASAKVVLVRHSLMILTLLMSASYVCG